MDPTLPELGWPISFLQLNDYIVCPKKFGHRHVFKDCPTEKKSSQQGMGIETHNLIARRLKLKESLPPHLSHYESTCDTLYNQEGRKHVELALGADLAGIPCSFFDDSCRVRGRLDFCIARDETAFIIDWKTGKPWEDPLELKLQGLLLKLHYPEIVAVKASYYWLRENRFGAMYDVSDVQRTWIDLHAKMNGMKTRITDNDWPADEGPLCPWCPVTKEMCQYKREPK